MVRTTVYLPEELKDALARAAKAEGCSEAELIRKGVRQVVDKCASHRPRIPLFASDDPTLSENVDEHLEGFGQS